MAYMTAADIRTRIPALAAEATFPTADLTDLIAEFEELAERYRGVAFEPRSKVETFVSDGDTLQLSMPKVRSITSVTVNGSATTLTYQLDGSTLSFSAPFPAGTTFDAVVVVTYAHGYDSPPTTILRACREYVRVCSLRDKSGVPRDVISSGTAGGGFTRYSTPDWERGRPTGYTDVDRALNSVQDMRVPGIA